MFLATVDRIRPGARVRPPSVSRSRGQLLTAAWTSAVRCSARLRRTLPKRGIVTLSLQDSGAQEGRRKAELKRNPHAVELEAAEPPRTGRKRQGKIPPPQPVVVPDDVLGTLYKDGRYGTCGLCQGPVAIPGLDGYYCAQCKSWISVKP
ncbi:hypothetical protein CCYA_CCYA15G3912 [Cyanidiococcus yangmingshanensis]|nr:hypothetical protein CCYA_CCYA15G3912 [Cyanidiococcus yangmingshanensis]